MLNLQSTDITDAGLAELSSLKNLEALRFDANVVNGNGLERLRELPLLTLLDLIDSMGTTFESSREVPSDFLDHVTKLPHLKILLLGDLEPNDRQMALLAKMPNLTDLSSYMSNDPDVHKALPKIHLWGPFQPAEWPKDRDPFVLFDTSSE